MSAIDTLSEDAKCLAGVWFGLMTPKKGKVTLQLVESRPAPRTQSALDELVEKGVISVEPYNKFGGLVYRPLIDCHDAYKYQARLFLSGKGDHVNWQLMEPLRSQTPEQDQENE